MTTVLPIHKNEKGFGILITEPDVYQCHNRCLSLSPDPGHQYPNMLAPFARYDVPITGFFNFLGTFVDLTNAVHSVHCLTKTKLQRQKIRWVTSRDVASISTRPFSASIMYKTFLQSKKHRFLWQTVHLCTVQEPKNREFSVSLRVWFVFLLQAGSNLLSLAAALIKYFRDERWYQWINVHLSKGIAQHQLLPLAWRWFKADFICKKIQNRALTCRYSSVWLLCKHMKQDMIWDGYLWIILLILTPDVKQISQSDKVSWAKRVQKPPSRRIISTTGLDNYQVCRFKGTVSRSSVFSGTRLHHCTVFYWL